MRWNVFRYDFNSGKIVTYNIFNHVSFAENVKKWLKKCDNKEEFAKELKRIILLFWLQMRTRSGYNIVPAAH